MEQQDQWMTLGKYLSQKLPGGALRPHQEFLKTFTLAEWKQYSALSHGAFESIAGTMGAVMVGAYYVPQFLPHEMRPGIEKSYGIFVSTHLGRAATVLLSILTELQAYCRFDGHNINPRICKIWDALQPLFEAKEVYDHRYAKLMADCGISKK